MNALQKKIISAAAVCGVLVAVGAVKWRSEVYAPDMDAAVQTAYRQAETDLVFWYGDPSYAPFFEQAAECYFEETGIKAVPEYQDTIDYMGDIYNKTMQDEKFPDVYLISGDNLEEAYLYGLVSLNGKQEAYGRAAVNAAKASSYEGQMYGYPLSYNTCLFVYQTGYFETEPASLQAIIDYSDQNEPAENVEYLLEWDVNDAFYDFPFISNSVTFEKTEPACMNVVYNESLYNKDLTFFEDILESFSVDAKKVSEDSIIENFLAGRTLCAIIDTDSLKRLEGYSYSLMEIPDLSGELRADTCATTDMLAVNAFSEKEKEAADFAEYVTVTMADRLHELTGHYSVIPSEEPEWTEQVAFASYEAAILVPDSQDARDFWVKLKETISKYF